MNKRKTMLANIEKTGNLNAYICHQKHLNHTLLGF
jgi:hypothetical protein